MYVPFKGFLLLHGMSPIKIVPLIHFVCVTFSVEDPNPLVLTSLDFLRKQKFWIISIWTTNIL